MSLFENWRNWNETNLVCVCGQRSERSRFSTATSNDLRPGNLIIFCLGLNALMAKRLTPCPLARYFQPVRVLIRLSVWAIFTRSVLGHGRLRSSTLTSIYPWSSFSRTHCIISSRPRRKAMIRLTGEPLPAMWSVCSKSALAVLLTRIKQPIPPLSGMAWGTKRPKGDPGRAASVPGL